jgi:CelD/BcsL family acetyltransferase involved in cellulose biosynthesis
VTVLPSIRVHDTLDDELRSAWSMLAAATPGAGYSSQPEWFDIVLASIPSASARIITRTGADGTQALIAARVDRVTATMRVGYRQVVPLRPVTYQVMEGGILGDTADADELLAAILDAAAAAKATVITLPRLALDHPLALAAQSIRRPWLRRPEPRSPHHRSCIGDGGYDELMAGSKSTRKRVRKYERTLSRDHEVTLEIFASPEELETFLTDATPIAESSYQHALGAGLGAPGEADRLRGLARLGWFRGFILSVDGEAWTFDYGMRFGDSFAAGATAYRPEHAKKRPGNIALARWIDELGRSGVAEIDWGAGDADYKQSLSTSVIDEQALVIYRRTPVGTLLAVLAAAVDLLDRAGRSVADRFGSAQKVKTRLRARLRRTPKPSASETPQ